MTELHPIEATQDGAPTWKCPVCPFSDGRYWSGGRSAVGNHIRTAHSDERTAS